MYESESGREPVQLTKVQRLIIANQLRILHHLQDDYGSLRIAEALENGYELHFDDAMQHISDVFTKDQCRFVLDVLDMHRMMRFAVEENDEELGNLRDRIKFRGFDGNHETDYMAYTNYFMSDPNVYEELKDQGNRIPFNANFNSHMPMVQRYKRMLEAWKSSPDPYNLSRGDLDRILEAFRAPA